MRVAERVVVEKEAGKEVVTVMAEREVEMEVVEEEVGKVEVVRVAERVVVKVEVVGMDLERVEEKEVVALEVDPEQNWSRRVHHQFQLVLSNGNQFDAILQEA